MVNNITSPTLYTTEWHPAFCCTMRLTFRENISDLDFTDELSLTDKPLRIDLLVVKKNEHVIVNNNIGKLYRGHNVTEYKGPGDSLNIDTLYKSFSYACLYKASSTHTNDIKANDITISIIRDIFPYKLFSTLASDGFTYYEQYSGIYYIEGGLFPTQIVVSSQLDEDSSKWLKSLTNNISETLFLDIIKTATGYTGKEKELSNIVLQAVTSGNKSTSLKWKEGDIMCDALMELMADELNESRLEGQITATIELLRELGTPDYKIHERLSKKYNLSDEEINKYLTI